MKRPSKLRLEHLTELNPLTKNQEKVFKSYKANKNLVLSGSAGTGKTFLALYLGLKDVLTKDNQLEKVTNKFIKKVTHNIENFSYNKIIANFHEIYSALNKIILAKIEKQKLVENYSKILIAISPVLPHFSNECIELLNIKSKMLWPKINNEILIENNIKFIIQFNGKNFWKIHQKV